ncbi:hypothetical protein F5Y01DRAFT_317365 [Xylaria sp. FL0043]|nr:hypothetical protein F5Y01DRAFT_317365 [Xylaria sp. FL0043]
MSNRQYSDLEVAPGRAPEVVPSRNLPEVVPGSNPEVVPYYYYNKESDYQSPTAPPSKRSREELGRHWYERIFHISGLYIVSPDVFVVSYADHPHPDCINFNRYPPYHHPPPRLSLFEWDAIRCGLRFWGAAYIPQVLYSWLPALLNEPTQSLNDCINACTDYNDTNKTAIATGDNQTCNAVCWRNNDQLDNIDQIPGQCFRYTTLNTSAGFAVTDEVLCDSAAWINQRDL